ncbi:FAD-binding oxidoreductase [Aspergillus clavatus NRRL 1]|uniref:D-lactate dehydrogenase (cytochrome) n=1 Tax=Aspergillus clavatus (strain ATCC 1007 / CBS 513.65 / DSM 816 / NCTC 3887 / NRRL 1 / QM 1276 / 107) TaxID=344612 RepID=A1CGJ6_ASPCL|nr:d-lactate dehydrogenase [Aspergillus clavatus NRRL 1]EAW11076.1 d-lactate dehydrogenase [Aspergillus clavatus NRRL 1]
MMASLRPRTLPLSVSRCVRPLPRRTTTVPHHHERLQLRTFTTARRYNQSNPGQNAAYQAKPRFNSIQLVLSSCKVPSPFFPVRLPWLIDPVIVAAGVGGYLIGRSDQPPPTTLSDKSTSPLEDCQPPNYDLTPENLKAACAEFAEIIGKDNVTTNADSMGSYSGSDWSSYTPTATQKPFVVVSPASTDEVSRIMKVCHRRRIPLTAYAGGTSLEGHFTPTRGGVSLDLQRMDNILALHKDDQDVHVQAGVGWEDLNAQLAKDGLFFPPDPGPGARIGGMVGTGCSGTNAYHYGTMRDWVLSLTVVLADGTVIQTRQRPRKSSAGYDLTRLFIGSEGTLGIVTEATLKLTPKPKNERVAIASFPSIQDAAGCVARVVEEGVNIAAVELLDDVQMKCVNAGGATERHWEEKPTLFFKFAGTKAAVDEEVRIVQELVKQGRDTSFEFARNAGEAEELWSARKYALWSIMELKKDPSEHVWTTDVAVPISRLPDIIHQTKEDINRSGLTGGIVGHVGDGNFHVMLLYSEKVRDVAEKLVHDMVERAIEMEGTITGEHGVGLVKRDFLPSEVGQKTVDTMRQVKQALDPLLLLNCDKILRVDPSS